MRVAVLGSRNIHDREFVFNKLSSIYAGLQRKGHRQFTFLYGGDKGVSRLTSDWVNRSISQGLDIEPIIFEPYHLLNRRSKFDSRNFYYRNLQMLNNADLVIIFWDNQSGETARAVDKTKEAGKPLVLVEYQT